VRSKMTIALRSGRVRGGGSVNRGALYHLLRNRTYLGEVPHGEASYPGLHAAIIERDVFEAVARRLNENTPARTRMGASTVAAPLRGRVFDADGAPMTPTVCYGRGKRPYRYYVSAALQQGAPRRGDELRRVPAPQLEACVREVLTRLEVRDAGGAALRRLEVHPEHVRLVLASEPSLRGPRQAALTQVRSRLLDGETLTPLADDAVEFLAPRRLSFVGGRTWLTDAANKPIAIEGRTDPAVVRALKSAHATLSDLGAAPTSSVQRVMQAKSARNPRLRAIARLAFLAPDIQSAILDGRLSPHLNVGALTAESLPLAWADQRVMFGR
jgi:site-specific DNA recombinase